MVRGQGLTLWKSCVWPQICLTMSPRRPPIPSTAPWRIWRPLYSREIFGKEVLMPVCSGLWGETPSRGSGLHHHKVCPPLCGALRKSVYYPWHPRGAAVPARPLLSVYSIPKPIMALGGLPPLRSVTEKSIQLFPAGHPFQGTNTLLREY